MTKIVAAEASAATVGTTTVYTVPASMMARIKMMWQVQANAAATTTFAIKIGAMTVYQIVLSQGRWCYTALPINQDGTIGAVDATKVASQSYPAIPPSTVGATAELFHSDANPIYLGSAAGETPGGLIYPLPIEYLLDAAQSVSYVLSGAAAQSCAFKLAGTEFGAY